MKLPVDGCKEGGQAGSNNKGDDEVVGILSSAATFGEVPSLTVPRAVK